MVPLQLCPRFHKAIELIGGRWTGPILRILLARPARFAELRDTIPHISDRMLAGRLRELESEGLIARSVIPESPVRVEYALTQKGRELQTSLEAVGKWAERWIAIPSQGGDNPRPRQSSRSRIARSTRERPSKSIARRRS